MNKEGGVPWQKTTLVAQRLEFVSLANQNGVPFRKLCDRFGIVPKTGYKWLKRYQEQGEAGLADLSRRPHHSPTVTSASIEELVCEVRRAHPVWGGRKIRAVLLRRGHREIPAPSTITGILRRHGLLELSPRPQRDLVRFEWEAPNELWQMDFKGDFATNGGRCYPLTVIDDHSRFNLCLETCPNQQANTVKDRLVGVFGRYGLPQRMLMDNGSPWGHGWGHGHTVFTTWLVDLGIAVIHSRPFHPQTQGKDERFHLTLQREVLAGRPPWRSLGEVQTAFDAWRPIYNHQRPHEALDDAVPADRYRPSPRSLPSVIEPWEYGPNDHVRKVSTDARISFRGRSIRVGKPFAGRYVALRPTKTDGVVDLYYRHQFIRRIDLSQ